MDDLLENWLTRSGTVPYRDLCRVNHVPNPKCCQPNSRHDTHERPYHLCKCHQFVFGQPLVLALLAHIVCIIERLISFDSWQNYFSKFNSINRHLRHLSQFSMNILPCNSAKFSLATPDRRCNPSMFWLTMYFMWPESSNALSAMWHFVGIASENETFTCGAFPSFSRVQTPFGPLKKIESFNSNVCVCT